MEEMKRYRNTDTRHVHFGFIIFSFICLLSNFRKSRFYVRGLNPILETYCDRELAVNVKFFLTQIDIDLSNTCS